MNRRDFLARLRKPALAIAAVPAIALAAADRGKQTIDPHVTALKSRLQEMKRRMDKMEKSHKRTVRVLLVVTGVLAGIDISLLI